MRATLLSPANWQPRSNQFHGAHGRGLVCLRSPTSAVEDSDCRRWPSETKRHPGNDFTVSIEARRGVTTGISAADRPVTIQTAIDPSKGRHRSCPPRAHVLPSCTDGGVLQRAGHTEAAVDLARLAGPILPA